jgi:hypothetical protein
LDVILLVSFILDEALFDYQQYIAADFNSDGYLNVLDVIALVNEILSRN